MVMAPALLAPPPASRPGVLLPPSGGIGMHGSLPSLPRPARLVIASARGFGKASTNAKKASPPEADMSTHPFPELTDYRPILWFNKGRGGRKAVESVPFTGKELDSAQDLWLRMAPLVSHLFPSVPGGVIEGPLKRLYNIESGMSGLGVKGMALLKQDSELPICGSVKARGGIYEVLEVAERAAIQAGLLPPDADRTLLATDPEIKKLLSGTSLVVGSTGNLGLSIGIFGAALGMKVEVHMSNDAKEWKKELLRSKGAEVVEHGGSYSDAVAAARSRAGSGGGSVHFVDDEGSRSLILGYSTAAFALVNQLEQLGVPVDVDHPLVIYLPCGVGGAPAGLTWGLRRVLGDHVHVLLAEPTHAPCATIGLATGKGAGASIADLGLDGVTVADGLAVRRVSALAHSVLKELVTGAFTVDDDDMMQALAQLLDLELTFIEPSCAAAFMGPAALAARALGAAPDTLDAAEAERTRELARRLLQDGTHVFWATGGGLVPDPVRQEYCDQGLAIMTARQQASG